MELEGSEGKALNSGAGMSRYWLSVLTIQAHSHFTAALYIREDCSALTDKN